MKRSRAVILVLTIFLVALLAWPAMAQAETTELVSVSSGGEQGNCVSLEPSISADGSTVAFTSHADNLVSGDSAYTDIFVRNLTEGTTELVSVGYDGSPANGGSTNPSISGDGSLVAFESTATNLVNGVTYPIASTLNIFVRNLQTKETQLVSVTHDGTAIDGGCEDPSISADGSVVAFQSWATNLVPDDTNGTIMDVFVRDLDPLAPSTEVVSLNDNGTQMSVNSGHPSVNADGSVVAFTSGLYPSPFDPPVGQDVLVRDRDADTTELVSVSVGGVLPNSVNDYPSINADGSVVAFVSSEFQVVSAAATVSGETAVAALPPLGLVSGPDVFVRDRVSNVTELISVSAGGVGADNANRAPSINADGSVVAFTSLPPPPPMNGGTTLSGATAVVGPVMPVMENVFVRDRKTGVTKLLSVGWDGSPSNGDSVAPSISADGSLVAFSSNATNLVAGDTNGADDVFVATHTRTWGFPNRYEDTDSRILFGGDWEEEQNKSHSGGSIHFSTDSDGTITITFKGTRLDWIAAMGPLMGQAMVSIDGGEPVLVDLFSDEELFQQLVWSTGNLEYGVHVITITFPENGEEVDPINIDALDVWGKLLETR